MVIKKSTLVTFKVEGLVISLIYGKGVELLVDGVCSSTVNSEIFARHVFSRNFAVKMFLSIERIVQGYNVPFHPHCSGIWMYV